MKRTVLSLGAAALVLAMGTAAFADDAPSTPPATTPAASTPAPASETKPMHHTASHKGAAKSMAINLNTASKEQLMTLPGIDDATADKIIAARPFAMRSELLKKSLVTKQEYAKIKSKVSAKKA